MKTEKFQGYYCYRTKNGRYVYLHREVYEMHYGPIPSGYIVHHKDGNKLNNSIENLELLSRAEHASVHHKGVPKTEEMKKKSSKTKMGHTVSQETREKIREKLKGRALPEETRRRMSESRKGKKRGPYKKKQNLQRMIQ